MISKFPTNRLSIIRAILFNCHLNVVPPVQGITKDRERIPFCKFYLFSTMISEYIKSHYVLSVFYKKISSFQKIFALANHYHYCMLLFTLNIPTILSARLSSRLNPQISSALQSENHIRHALGANPNVTRPQECQSMRMKYLHSNLME